MSDDLTTPTFSKQPFDRYARQMRLPGMGMEAQLRISKAVVAIIGCGALGSVVADLLARAGVGRLRLIDRDTVDLSNLHRQTLYTEAHAHKGMPKAEAAAEQLALANSLVCVEPTAGEFDATTALPFLAGCDVAIDATDNAAARYLLNDACLKLSIPWVYGGAVGWEGRCALFLAGGNGMDKGGAGKKGGSRERGGACLRCLFPNPPSPGELPTCETAGVLSGVSACVATLQATLALRYLAGDIEAAGNKPPPLTTIDLRTFRFGSISLFDAADENCPACALHRYDFLDAPVQADAVSLCGRNTLQVRLGRSIDLSQLAARWANVAGADAAAGVSVFSTRFMTRLSIEPNTTLTAFADGRVLVAPCESANVAKTLIGRWIGT